MYWADMLLSEVSQNVTAGANGVKYMMVQAGVNVGDSRLPFLGMTDDDKKRQDTNMRHWCQETGSSQDVIGWCNRFRKHKE